MSNDDKPKIVICRATGETVGDSYRGVRCGGRPGAEFYNTRSGQTEKMPKAKFDLLYRLEECK